MGRITYALAQGGVSHEGDGAYQLTVGQLFKLTELTVSPSASVYGDFKGESVVPTFNLTLTGPLGFWGYPGLTVSEGYDVKSEDITTNVGASFVSPSFFSLLGLPSAGLAVSATLPGVDEGIDLTGLKYFAGLAFDL